MSHLLFVDYSLFFLQFNTADVWCLWWIIEAYCAFAGQKVNKSKSAVLLSPNMCNWQKEFIGNVLGIKIVAKPGIYLGTDLDFSRKNGELLGRILCRMRARLSGWKV